MSSALAKEYFDRIETKKQFYWFEKSCHFSISETKCYGVASDEKQIVIYRYKNDDSESRVVAIIAL